MEDFDILKCSSAATIWPWLEVVRTQGFEEKKFIVAVVVVVVVFVCFGHGWRWSEPKVWAMFVFRFYPRWSKLQTQSLEIFFTSVKAFPL